MKNVLLFSQQTSYVNDGKVFNNKNQKDKSHICQKIHVDKKKIEKHEMDDSISEKLFTFLWWCSCGSFMDNKAFKKYMSDDHTSQSAGFSIFYSL